MRVETKRRIALVLGLLCTPVVGVTLLAGAATYDGGTVGSVLIVALPLGLYGVGLHLILQGFAQRIHERESNAA